MEHLTRGIFEAAAWMLLARQEKSAFNARWILTTNERPVDPYWATQLLEARGCVVEYNKDFDMNGVEHEDKTIEF